MLRSGVRLPASAVPKERREVLEPSMSCEASQRIERSLLSSLGWRPQRNARDAARGKRCKRSDHCGAEERAVKGMDHEIDVEACSMLNERLPIDVRQHCENERAEKRRAGCAARRARER